MNFFHSMRGALTYTGRECVYGKVRERSCWQRPGGAFSVLMNGKMADWSLQLESVAKDGSCCEWYKARWATVSWHAAECVAASVQVQPLICPIRIGATNPSAPCLAV